MDSILLYTDFLEGNLDEDEEKAFTRALTENNEFRKDFRTFLVITNTITSGIEEEVFPPGLTESLYEKLGYKTDEELEKIRLKQEFEKEKNSTNGRKFFFGFLVGTFFFILWLFVYHRFLSPSSDKQLLTNGKGLTEDLKLYLPKLDNYEEINNKKPQIISTKAQNLSKNEDNSSKSKTTIDNQLGNKINQQKLNNLSESKFNDNQNINPFGLNKSVSNIVPEMKEALYQSLIGEFKSGKISVILDNHADWSLPHQKIAYVNISPLNNFSLSVLYELNDMLKIGAEIRPETFYLEYTGTETDSTFYQYYQQSNLTTYSLKGKIYPFEYENINSIIQMGIGFNKGGCVLRPLLGIEYEISPGFRINAGVEYSHYLYKHQSKLYYSSKLGIHYGIILKL